MIVDLQVNLETKDGGLVDPNLLVEKAKAAGLDGVVVTKEGDLMPDVQSFRDVAAPHGFKVFAGAKVATNHGLLLCILPSTATRPSEGFAQRVDDVYDANAVIDAVEQLGGVTVALRPYDRDVPRPMGDHLFSLQGLAACEVQNGRISDIANDLALEAASNMEMPCVGTSCADGTEGLGSSATLFRAKVETETDLVEAIRSGDCWPVSFSDRAPKPEARDNGDRRRDPGRGRDRGERREGRGGRGGDRREGGGRGGRERGERGGRGRGGGGGGGSGGGPRAEGEGGGRRRRRGGRGRGRGGPPAEDIGNRAKNPNRGQVDEDIGNRRPGENELDEDIGNRLRPGETNPFSKKDDDEYGNR